MVGSSMRLSSLGFAGYRSFAARSPRSRERTLECLRLAPLTILLGKNNSGKSTVGRLLHHVLLAIGHEGLDPFPMSGAGQTFGDSFRDVQHNGRFFNPLELEVELHSEGGAQSKLAVQLVSSSADDRMPVVQSLSLDGIAWPVETRPLKGLLPPVDAARQWRDGAHRLLASSCYLGPLRERVHPNYKVDAQELGLPRSSAAVAQILRSDGELRATVAEWMAKNLEGWRVDVQQTLELFSLLARRPGRESNLAVSGQGIQQVLPVAVLCCWRRLGRGEQTFLDVIEQPELHLHDAAHAPLGDLLLSAVATGRGSVVVETHSESVVLRIRRRIAEGLSPDKVALVYVEDTGEGSRLRPIPVRPDGEVEWWPEGVFSEAFVEVKAIRRAQRAHGGA